MVQLLSEKYPKEEDSTITNGTKNVIASGKINGNTNEFESANYLEKVSEEELQASGYKTHREVPQDYKWDAIIGIAVLHIGLVYTLLIFPYLTYPHYYTVVFAFIYGEVGAFGVTAGVHRYWTHRSYKAKLPLRIILLLCYMTTGMNSIASWVRDHRVHHKYSETDADPHNSSRGFFFSHCGWLMMKKHPEVLRRGNEIDMSDVISDPVVKFQEKYFLPLKLFFTAVLPVCVPVFCWNEAWTFSVLSILFVRWPVILNGTWSVNSVAHIWGSKPYDKNIAPTENIWVSYVTLGEGWHNYHHTFPWDYKAAEIPYYFNVTTLILDLFSVIGWAYDLKTPSANLVKAVKLRRGQGAHVKEVEPPTDKVY